MAVTTIKNVKPKAKYVNATNSKPTYTYRKAAAPQTSSADSMVRQMANPYTPPAGGGDSSTNYGGDTTAYDASAYAAPAVVQPSGEELAKLGEADTGYQNRLKSLNDALAAYEADQTAQKTRYNTNYKDSLKSLGWDFAPAKELSDTAAVPTMDELVTMGKWNEGDRTTAAGRGVSNQLEDFASRGMTDSSFFARAKNDLMKTLNEQLLSTVKGRKSFSEDLATQRRAYGVEDQANRQAALEDAKNRVLSQWALTNA